MCWPDYPSSLIHYFIYSTTHGKNKSADLKYFHRTKPATSVTLQPTNNLYTYIQNYIANWLTEITYP